MPPKKNTEKKKPKIGDKNLFHFNPDQIQAKMESYFEGEVEPEAAIFLTAVLQYFAAEMIELSGNLARDKSPGKKSGIAIKEEDVLEAIDKDEELKQLMKALGSH